MKKRGYLKCKIILSIVAILTPLIFIMGLLIFAISSSAEPISPPATEDKASEYQLICSALGVSWDIPLLVDAMLNKERIDDCNVLDTALEFVILEECRFSITEEVKIDDNEVEQITQYRTYSGSTEYVGKDSVIEYVGEEWRTVNELVTVASQIAESKNTEDTAYEVMFKANANIESILSSKFGLSEDEVKNIMELHESNYIIQLYKCSVSIGTIKIGAFDENEPAIWKFLELIGFNEIGRAAAMGNMKTESSYDPNANNNNNYFGICQWGLGRWTGNTISLSSYAAQVGTAWNDLETQLNFFNLECSTSYSNVYAQMKTATDLIYATDYFCVYYEGCVGDLGDSAVSIINGKVYQGLAERRANALDILQRYSVGYAS